MLLLLPANARITDSSQTFWLYPCAKLLNIGPFLSPTALCYKTTRLTRPSGPFHFVSCFESSFVRDKKIYVIFHLIKVLHAICVHLAISKTRKHYSGILYIVLIAFICSSYRHQTLFSFKVKLQISHLQSPGAFFPTLLLTQKLSNSELSPFKMIACFTLQLPFHNFICCYIG